MAKPDRLARILGRKSKSGQTARRVSGGGGVAGWERGRVGGVMPTVNPKIKTQHPAVVKCSAAVIKAFPSTNESAGKRSIVN